MISLKGTGRDDRGEGDNKRENGELQSTKKNRHTGYCERKERSESSRPERESGERRWVDKRRSAE
jgi:hypothetical protein